MINIKELYNKTCRKILKESFKVSEAHTEGASDHEFAVAEEVKKYFKALRKKYPKVFTLNASRPNVSSRYSDIKVYDERIADDNKEDSIKNDFYWIEVKKEHGDIIYNGRCSYKGNRWGGGSSFSSSTKFTDYNINGKSGGVWNVLGGGEKDETGVVQETSLSKTYKDYLNNLSEDFADDHGGKSPYKFINILAKFLNLVKNPKSKEHKEYFNKNLNLYLNYFSVFNKNGKDSVELFKIEKDEKERINWLKNIKDLDSGDIILVGGRAEGPGRIGPFVLKDFLSWFNNASDNDAEGWPMSKSHKGERVRKLIDFPQKDFDLKNVLIQHYTVDKIKPAYYIQMGDDFFGIDKSKNPGCFKDIVFLNDKSVFPEGMPGSNYLNIAFNSSNVTKGYSIRIKAMEAKNWSSVPSKYSFYPNSKKENSNDGMHYPPIDIERLAKILDNSNSNESKKSIKEAEEDPSKKTIALVGGSFKPPHAGHFDMVEQYAKKADKVIVVISDPKKSIRTTKNGTVITPKMAKAIWDIYVDRYGLGNKVEVKISSQASPIAAIYDYIDNTLKDCNIILGASKKDNDFKRFAKAESYFVKEGRDDINILDPESTAVDPYANNGKPISAGQIRDNIDDPEIIKSMLPKKLNSDDIDSIISILSDEI